MYALQMFRVSNEWSAYFLPQFRQAPAELFVGKTISIRVVGIKGVLACGTSRAVVAGEPIDIEDGRHLGARLVLLTPDVSGPTCI
jgi:hypothetical protein